MKEQQTILVYNQCLKDLDILIFLFSRIQSRVLQTSETIRLNGNICLHFKLKTFRDVPNLP